MGVKFTAYITRYALTAGIIAKEVEDCFDISPTMVTAGRNETFHDGDWHRTREEALTKAELMRGKKIASLEKSIAKLRKLDFSRGDSFPDED